MYCKGLHCHCFGITNNLMNEYPQDLKNFLKNDYISRRGRGFCLQHSGTDIEIGYAIFHLGFSHLLIILHLSS